MIRVFVFVAMVLIGLSSMGCSAPGTRSRLASISTYRFHLRPVTSMGGLTQTFRHLAFGGAHKMDTYAFHLARGVDGWPVLYRWLPDMLNNDFERRQRRRFWELLR